MVASAKSAAYKKFSGEKKEAWWAKNSNAFKPTVDYSYNTAVGLYELAKGGGVVRKIFINGSNSTGRVNQQSKLVQDQEPVIQSDKQACNVSKAEKEKINLEKESLTKNEEEDFTSMPPLEDIPFEELIGQQEQHFVIATHSKDQVGHGSNQEVSLLAVDEFVPPTQFNSTTVIPNVAG